MELSGRLLAVASLVTAGYRVVDIGTDHAYIPIYLVQKGLTDSAIAMDINEGPLKRAKAHVKESGMEGKIGLRLSDGFEKLRPSEADAAVLAGMGGPLMIRLLKEYPETVLSLQELILQPQSETAKVRAFLLEEGFFFLREDMVKDDGKYYSMMKVSPPHRGSVGSSYGRQAGARDVNEGRVQDEPEARDTKKSNIWDEPEARDTKKSNIWDESGVQDRKKSSIWNEPEAWDTKKSDIWDEPGVRYGKLLLEMRHPVLREYLDREYVIRQNILSGLKGRTGEKIRKRRAELEEEMKYIRKGLEYYAV